MGVFMSRTKPSTRDLHTNIDVRGSGAPSATLASGCAFLCPAPVADVCGFELRQCGSSVAGVCGFRATANAFLSSGNVAHRKGKIGTPSAPATQLHDVHNSCDALHVRGVRVWPTQRSALVGNDRLSYNMWNLSQNVRALRIGYALWVLAGMLV